MRKFSTTLLAVCVFIAGCVLIHYCVTGPNGDVIGGWSLDPAQIRIGLTRLLYPFFAGLLLSRVVTVGSIRHAFLLSSLIIIAALALPRFGGPAELWKNGLYDALCIVLVFPLVVYIGASGQVSTRLGARMCGFLGAISYPIYIIHYPFVYTYTAWVAKGKVPLAEALPWTIATFVACVVVAYVCLTCYDIPLRQWLDKRFMRRRVAANN